MKTANCPSCGAPVTFRSSASLLAVCGYCKSTLIRHDLNLENLGRMADLMEDASPLQLGAEGRYKNSHFGVIGRIQLRYQQGLWNEWHLLFDDRRAGGCRKPMATHCTPSHARAPGQAPPSMNAKEAAQRLQFHGGLSM